MVVDVIVLSPDEKFIAWLDTTVVDLKETNEATMIKEVQLQHILTVEAMALSLAFTLSIRITNWTHGKTKLLVYVLKRFLLN